MQEAIERLATFTLAFGQVHRQCFHPDGETLESDAEHTVMIGVLGAALAARLYPELDRGLIAQFALVHDLVETYAGDTPTLMNAHAQVLAEKEQREADALRRIEREFGVDFPWLPEMIKKYEALDTKEARYIKVLDKVLPKITNILCNGAAASKLHQATLCGVRETFAKQRELIERLAYDMPELISIWEDSVDQAISLMGEEK